MRLALTDDQLAIRDLCRSLFAERRSSSELWRQCVELGLSTAVVPSKDGGLGLGPVEAAVIAEESGRSLTAVPLVATLGLAAVARSASLRRTLGAIAGGQAGAVVVGGPLASPIESLPAPDADAGRLLGLTLRRGHGVTAVAVSCPHGGLLVRPALDPLRPLARVTLSAADLQSGEQLEVTEPSWLPVPALTRAAAAVGVVGRILELAVEHAVNRRQFGHPIGSFQAVKHRLVDAEIAVERARSLVYGAVAGLAGDHHDGAAYDRAALAVSAAGDAALHAARAAVHVHGAAGITSEHPVSLLYARARQMSSLLRYESALASSI
jgi:alkylation response protein AidB-like acyl-CoA dehydrogenase